ncbi:MAG: NAD-dependent epimerase/dehydratase family protein [Sulfolobaceae archaeon]|nr:NAD-dependent epimerase/dehydratase family protein [Sulfolobaceae archaeon]
MQVLITGGAGFIGSHLVDLLMEKGYKVRVIDNLSYGRLENLKKWLDDRNLEFIKGDLRDISKLSEAMKGVDIVYHLAANPEVRLGEQDPRNIFELNVLITYNVLEAMKANNVKYLAYASSSTVYGEAKVMPTPEDYSPLEPISVYGGAKLASEATISGFVHTFHLSATIFRLANIVGSRSRHGVIYDFIRKLRANSKKLEILGDGTQKKSYLHISDTVEAMYYLTEDTIRRGVEYEVYNIGSEDNITVIDIAKIVSEEMGLSPEIYTTGGVDGGRGWRGDVKYMLLDIKKAKSKGWSPKINTSEGAVKRAVKELLDEVS